jgi:hypothetical protein
MSSPPMQPPLCRTCCMWAWHALVHTTMGTLMASYFCRWYGVSDVLLMAA